MRIVDRILFTLISTMWIAIIYAIDHKCSIILDSFISTTIILISVPIILSALWLLFIRITKSSENISLCSSVEEINNDFLANYLCYFFVGLGLDDVVTLFFAFGIIFTFTFASQNHYFNAVLLIFGYKYYSVETREGTKILVISQNTYRNSDALVSNKLRRVKDGVFLELR